ncbi:MAG: PLP-dependent aspartate aminotransferase family protein [Chloroflexota bacterium]|nr:PLP-dependent aspartate aminotransferase family protein [Chloroflexota bacterium]
MTDPKIHRLATRAVHAGTRPPHLDFIPTVTPIHPSVTYQYERMEDLDGVFAGTRQGYVYHRYGNPTVTALEEAVAALEEGETALAFASGMAAIHAALLATGARAGSAVVAAQDIYGATYALLDQLMRSQGVTVRFVDVADLETVVAVCAELQPVALLVETISNPLLKVADLPALADVAHRHGSALLVDNTFATPCLVQPLKLGADVVIHSSTKYLGGHGDVLSGIVVTSEARRANLFEVLKVTGANLGPQEAWLVQRGIKTLPLRMRQHCENGLAVARWLGTHSKVSRVNYPGLPSHPQHALAARLFQERGYGGMVSFDLDGADKRQVFCFFEALRLCLPATTLGDVYTLALYPAHSSHRALSSEERARIGIGDGLVRLSVGIEAVEDILSDLEQALDVLG